MLLPGSARNRLRRLGLLILALDIVTRLLPAFGSCFCYQSVGENKVVKRLLYRTVDHCDDIDVGTVSHVKRRQNTSQQCSVTEAARETPRVGASTVASGSDY